MDRPSLAVIALLTLACSGCEQTKEISTYVEYRSPNASFYVRKHTRVNLEPFQDVSKFISGKAVVCPAKNIRAHPVNFNDGGIGGMFAPKFAVISDPSDSGSSAIINRWMKRAGYYSLRPDELGFLFRALSLTSHDRRLPEPPFKHHILSSHDEDARPTGISPPIWIDNEGMPHCDPRETTPELAIPTHSFLHFRIPSSGVSVYLKSKYSYASEAATIEFTTCDLIGNREPAFFRFRVGKARKQKHNRCMTNPPFDSCQGLISLLRDRGWPEEQVTRVAYDDSADLAVTLAALGVVRNDLELGESDDITILQSRQEIAESATAPDWFEQQADCHSGR